MVRSIHILRNDLIMDKLKFGMLYQKKDLTELRLINKNEDQKPHTTYIFDKKTHSIQVETTNIMSKTTIVARNIKEIGKDLDGNSQFNEWLISPEIVVTNYGEEVLKSLTHQFMPYPKIKTIRVIQINHELFNIFKSNDAVDTDNAVRIAVDWGSGEMIAREGDFLTDQGYAISAKNIEDDYEIIQEKRSFSDSIRANNSPIFSSRTCQSISTTDRICPSR